jgi:hypothetical protein
VCSHTQTTASRPEKEKEKKRKAQTTPEIHDTTTTTTTRAPAALPPRTDGPAVGVVCRLTRQLVPVEKSATPSSTKTAPNFGHNLVSIYGFMVGR